MNGIVLPYIYSAGLVTHEVFPHVPATQRKRKSRAKVAKRRSNDAPSRTGKAQKRRDDDEACLSDSSTRPCEDDSAFSSSTRCSTATGARSVASRSSTSSSSSSSSSTSSDWSSTHSRWAKMHESRKLALPVVPECVRVPMRGTWSEPWPFVACRIGPEVTTETSNIALQPPPQWQGTFQLQPWCIPPPPTQCLDPSLLIPTIPPQKTYAGAQQSNLLPCGAALDMLHFLGQDLWNISERYKLSPCGTYGMPLQFWDPFASEENAETHRIVRKLGYKFLTTGFDREEENVLHPKTPFALSDEMLKQIDIVMCAPKGKLVVFLEWFLQLQTRYQQLRTTANLRPKRLYLLCFAMPNAVDSVNKVRLVERLCLSPVFVVKTIMSSDKKGKRVFLCNFKRCKGNLTYISGTHDPDPKLFYERLIVPKPSTLSEANRAKVLTGHAMVKVCMAQPQEQRPSTMSIAERLVAAETLYKKYGPALLETPLPVLSAGEAPPQDCQPTPTLFLFQAAMHMRNNWKRPIINVMDPCSAPEGQGHSQSEIALAAVFGSSKLTFSSMATRLRGIPRDLKGNAIDAIITHPPPSKFFPIVNHLVALQRNFHETLLVAVVCNVDKLNTVSMAALKPQCVYIPRGRTLFHATPGWLNKCGNGQLALVCFGRWGEFERPGWQFFDLPLLTREPTFQELSEAVLCEERRVRAKKRAELGIGDSESDEEELAAHVSKRDIVVDTADVIAIMETTTRISAGMPCQRRRGAEYT